MAWLISGMLSAQSSWKSSYDNKADFLHVSTSDGKYIIGTTQKDICVLDGTNGQKVWSNSFKDMADIKSCESQYFMEEAGVLFLSDKKMGKDNIMAIDIADGKVLWKTDRFEGVRISSIVYFPSLKSFAVITKDGLVALDARTGETRWTQSRFTGSLADWDYLEASDELVLLNYKTSWGALFSGYKNQLMKIKASTGELIWETEYFGVIPTKYYTGQIISKMYVEGDRVFCLINGMQVFDLKTGQKQWQADYDVYDHKIGLGAESFWYDGIAEPLVVGDEVYLVKFKHASKKVSIEKRSLKDGSVKWETQMETKPDAVPTMAVENAKLILQLGGRVNIQGKDNQGVYFSKNKWVDPFRVEVYDAATGNFVWKSDKLKDRITNLVVMNGQIYVADEKHFFAFDVNDGAVKLEQKLEVGDAQELYVYNGQIGILGEKGFNMVNPAGESQYLVKLKEPYTNCPNIGDNFLLMNEDEIRIISLQSGKEKLAYKKEKKYHYQFAEDGSYLLTMSPKSVQRFSLL